jgi:hypothetical protein
MRALLIGMVAIALVSVACSNSSPDVDPVAQPAVTDLADRLGVEESIITVASVEEVTWSDGSLGCPEPGMMYTQSLVDGSLIVLVVDGLTYEYHSGSDTDPFYCESPAVPVSSD